jgi:miniconductance mechanosensitive channel
MDTTTLQAWVSHNFLLAISSLTILCMALLFFTRNVLAQGLHSFALRTATRVDDILVQHLRPMRIAWLAPFLVVFATAMLFPEYEVTIRKIALLFILVISVLTITGLLDAINEIYENRPTFNGVSIQSYLDIIKILLVLVAIILGISLVSGESPLVLLTGLGALTAVLLLIFQNTLLSLVASIQIVAHDLIKEGDWLEVPSYDADGDVVDISLHTIKIQNFDKTFTVIPTYKIVDVAYKNWRGMQESGGRRIQRSILVDMTTIKFCDEDMLAKLRKINLIQEHLDEKLAMIRQFQVTNDQVNGSPLDGPQITNIEIFRSYIIAYLKQRPDIAQEGMPFLVRSLAPNPTGLPIEIYIFTRTTVWAEYEAIQSAIFDHLLAAASHFDLRVFQEPTGLDFASLGRNLSA